MTRLSMKDLELVKGGIRIEIIDAKRGRVTLEGDFERPLLIAFYKSINKPSMAKYVKLGSGCQYEYILTALNLDSFQNFITSRSKGAPVAE